MKKPVLLFATIGIIAVANAQSMHEIVRGENGLSKHL
jgi:hypothetical protein